jgi:hypothetical protein
MQQSDAHSQGLAGPSRIHRILERLTVSKMLIGLLRLRLRRGTLEPVEVEAHLDRIEGEIDATVSVATNMHAENTGTA